MERATFCFRTASAPEVALVAAGSEDVIVAAVDDLAAVDVPGVEVVGAEANLGPDTAVTGVVDAGARLGVVVDDDDGAGLVADDVVETADKCDADPDAAVTEAASVLEAEGREEAEGERVAAVFFLAGGSSPSKGTFRGWPLGLLNGIISAN